MIKRTLIMVSLGLLVSTIALGDTVFYTNDCSSLAQFTSDNPTETTIVATGGIDGGPCVEYLSRAEKLNLTLNLPSSINLSSNSEQKTFYLTYSVSGEPAYAVNPDYSIFAIIDGSQTLIYNSGSTQTYNVWATKELDLRSTTTDTPYMTGTLTGFVFHLGRADRYIQFDGISLSQVPEPITLCLVGFGGIGLMCHRRK